MNFTGFYDVIITLLLTNILYPVIESQCYSNYNGMTFSRWTSALKGRRSGCTKIKTQECLKEKPLLHMTTRMLHNLPSTGLTEKNSKEIPSKYSWPQRKTIGAVDEVVVPAAAEAAVVLVDPEEEAVAAVVAEVLEDLAVAEMGEISAIETEKAGMEIGNAPTRTATTRTLLGETNAIAATSLNQKALGVVAAIDAEAAVEEIEMEA